MSVRHCLEFVERWIGETSGQRMTGEEIVARAPEMGVDGETMLAKFERFMPLARS